MSYLNSQYILIRTCVLSMPTLLVAKGIKFYTSPSVLLSIHSQIHTTKPDIVILLY